MCIGLKSQYNYYKVSSVFICTCLLILMSSCKPSPQQVRRYGDKPKADSATLAQMQFNMHMADAADKACLDLVKSDSGQYVMDEFGFWYKKEVQTSSDTLLSGQEVTLDIEIRELNGVLLADIHDNFVIGSDQLPMAIHRSLKMMGVGDKMAIVAPWYTAYGIEGTNIIKPYSNLIILLHVKE